MLSFAPQLIFTLIKAAEQFLYEKSKEFAGVQQVLQKIS